MRCLWRFKATRAHFGTCKHAYGAQAIGGNRSLGETVGGETGCAGTCNGSAAVVSALTMSLPGESGAGGNAAGAKQGCDGEAFKVVEAEGRGVGKLGGGTKAGGCTAGCTVGAAAD